MARGISKTNDHGATHRVDTFPFLSRRETTLLPIPGSPHDGRWAPCRLGLDKNPAIRLSPETRQEYGKLAVPWLSHPFPHGVGRSPPPRTTDTYGGCGRCGVGRGDCSYFTSSFRDDGNQRRNIRPQQRHVGWRVPKQVLLSTHSISYLSIRPSPSSAPDIKYVLDPRPNTRCSHMLSRVIRQFSSNGIVYYCHADDPSNQSN